MTGESRATTAPPTTVGGAVTALFGERSALAERFVAHLGTTAVERGLIGPREVPRLWERHVLNCAVVAELLVPGQRCVDVGSGAGLPGIAVALARPEVAVTLVEPLQRRVEWLGEVIDDLGLPIEVVRARAEDLHGRGARYDVALARAVAPLARLARWSLPLVLPGGRLVALKGRTAEVELTEAAETLERLGAAGWRVAQCGAGLLTEATTVVVVEAGAVTPVSTPQRAGRGGDPASQRRGGRPRR